MYMYMYHMSSRCYMYMYIPGFAYVFLQATAEANNLNAQNSARDKYSKEMEKVRHV